MLPAPWPNTVDHEPEARDWDAERIRAHAEACAEERFAKALREIVAGEAAQPS